MRILVADGVPETLRSMQMILTPVPNVEIVGVALSGVEAVWIAATYRPDIALVGVSMPDMNGLEAIRRIRAHRPETVCIIVSAEQDAVTIKQAVDAGVAAFLIRPFTGEQVLAIIERSRKVMLAARAKAGASHLVQPERLELLEQTAGALVKARRTDKAAVSILEALAAMPDCPSRWLTHLAIVYALRGDWRKLRRLSAYLEQRRPDTQNGGENP